MNLHETQEFKEWYSKPVVNMVTTGPLDHIMVCWVVAFSGRIPNSEDSRQRLSAMFAKKGSGIDVNSPQVIERFNEIFDFYDGATDESLGITKQRFKEPQT